MRCEGEPKDSVKYFMILEFTMEMGNSFIFSHPENEIHLPGTQFKSQENSSFHSCYGCHIGLCSTADDNLISVGHKNNRC